MAGTGEAGAAGKFLDLWLLPLPAPMQIDEVRACEGVLSPDELAAAARFRDTARREQALAARTLVRRALSRRLGDPPETWRFEVSPRGRPRLADRRRDVDFNAAHCDGFVVCALAGGLRVGVDVEARSRETEMRAVAARFVAPSEHGLDLPWLWTLKESLAKGVGLGLGLDFRRLAFDLAEAEPVCRAAKRWRFRAFDANEHAVALAWRGGEAAVSTADARPLLFGV